MSTVLKFKFLKRRNSRQKWGKLATLLAALLLSLGNDFSEVHAEEAVIHYPPFVWLQKALLQEFHLDSAPLSDLRRRFRLRHWVPKVSVSGGYSNSDSSAWQLSGINNSIRSGFSIDARVDFALPELVADNHEISLHREQMKMIEEKRKLLTELQRHYCAALKLQKEIQASADAGTDQSALIAKLFEEELTLNILTGGAIDQWKRLGSQKRAEIDKEASEQFKN